MYLVSQSRSKGAASTLAGALVNVTGSPLTAATGNVVINAAANVTVAGSGLTLSAGSVVITAAAHGS